jgi:four helix bundle protein
MAYSHAKLAVYKESLEFTAWVANALKPALKGRDSDIANQISRASQSVVLNIAEGGARWEDGEQRRFYLIARASASECNAALDVIRVSNLYDVTRPDWIDACERSDRIGAWMVRLISSVERRIAAKHGKHVMTWRRPR